MNAAKARTAAKTTPAAGDRVGRGARWTDDQVKLLLDSVKGSSTAKDAFEKVARQLGKNTGTVAQKYYNLQKQAGGATRRRVSGARAVAATSGSSVPRRAAGAVAGAADLKTMPVDELVGLATRVKAEIDRRRKELDAASKLLAR